MARKLAPPEILVNVAKLVTAHYGDVPDPTISLQLVTFDTSGHRGKEAA